MLKVAIAEDDFRVAQIQEEFLLKIKDVKVIGKALNAKETMELLQKEEIDLLLLDNYLPDGIELTYYHKSTLIFQTLTSLW